MPEMLTLLVLMVTVWTAGRAFSLMGLPVVFGELIGGIIVGPSVLGLVSAESDVVRILSELGIFFMMMHTGLKTDHEELLHCSLPSLAIAFGGMLVPFFGGFFVALAFGQPTVAALFIGTGLSISAIPLAVRLFKDCNMEGTRIAHIALGAAILDDICALVLFSIVLSVAETGSLDPLSIALLILKVAAFFVAVIIVGTKSAPFLRRMLQQGKKGFSLTLIIALAMGLIAEWIGLHLIIGAFLAGLFIREEFVDQKVFEKIEDRYYGLSYSFLGPIFFASLAFHLDLTAVVTAPLFLGAIILVAIAGKVIGCGGAAALMKMRPSESLFIGFAMNSRGAVELIVASIGLSMGIIDETVFSILIIMAFTTTVISIVASTPLAKRVRIGMESAAS